MSRRRVLFVAACIVCLLALTLTLPAADPRLDAPGVDGAGGAWAPVTGEEPAEPTPEPEGERDEVPRRGGGGNGPGVGDDGPPDVKVSGELIPGTQAVIEPANVDPGEDGVYVDGTFVGEGRTVVTVPFAAEMTVSVPDASVERTFDLQTDATIQLGGPAVQNSEVVAAVRIDDEPISDVTLTRDGTPVGSTDDEGTLEIRMPERTGSVELTVQDKPIDAAKTVQLPEPRVSFNSVLLLPGGPAPVQVTANGEPVPDASVSVLGSGRAETNENGIARVGLPVDNEVTVVLQMEGAESRAVAGRLYARLTVIVLIPLGVAGGVAYTYLSLVARAETRSGPGVDRERRDLGTTTRLFVGFGDFLSSLIGLFRVPSFRLPRLSLSGGGLAVPSMSALVPSLPRPRAPSLGSMLSGVFRGSPSSSRFSRLNPFGSRDEQDEAGEEGASLAAEPLGPDAPESEVRALWHTFLDKLGVHGRETMTPGQVARRAVGAGFPARQVRRLLRVFRQAEYGDDGPSEDHVERARSATTDLVSHEPPEGEE